MKTKLFFSALFLFLSLQGFSRDRSAHLQVEFQGHYTYTFLLGDMSFRVSEVLFIDDLRSGYYPIEIYQLSGRKSKLVYRGGINLAARSTTYAVFTRNDLRVVEVVPHEIIEVIPEILPMDNTAFYAFKSSVANEWFDSSRLELLEMTLGYHYFTAQQISILMDELSFDSSKLQFAKAAFLRTVDPENYFLVREKLGYSSSKSELTQYISQF